MKLTAFFLAVLMSAVSAEDKKPSTPAEPAKTGEAAAAAEKVYSPTDLQALKEVIGKKIVVEGTITSQGEAKYGKVRYLNFSKDYRQSLSLVFFPDTGNEQFTKEKLGEFVGKKVRVTGLLSDRDGLPQMKMGALDQIKVVQP